MSRQRFRSGGSDLNRYLASLSRAGFSVSQRRGGHWHIRLGSQLVATCSASPSADGTRKIQADVARGLRRLGLPWPQEG